MIHVILFILSILHQSEGEIQDYFAEKQNFEQSVERGRKLYNQLNDQGSECWRTAIESLNSSCDSMNDVDQSIMSLSLTFCHLTKSGVNVEACSEILNESKESRVRRCTLKFSSDPVAFNVYTHFFTHVTDICYYLRSTIWKLEQRKLINDLQLTSQNVVSKIAKSFELQNQIKDLQTTALRGQEEIISKGHQINDNLLEFSKQSELAHQRLIDIVTLGEKIFNQTLLVVVNKLDSLHKLTSAIFGEILSFHSVFFYIVYGIFIFFSTTTLSTSEARLPLFLSLCIILIMDRVITTYISRINSNFTYFNVSLLLRRLYMLFSLVYLLYKSLTYKNFETVNHNILMEMQSQLKSIVTPIPDLKRKSCLKLKTPSTVTIQTDVVSKPLNCKNLKAFAQAKIRRKIVTEACSIPLSFEGIATPVSKPRLDLSGFNPISVTEPVNRYDKSRLVPYENIAQEQRYNLRPRKSLLVS